MPFVINLGLDPKQIATKSFSFAFIILKALNILKVSKVGGNSKGQNMLTHVN